MENRKLKKCFDRYFRILDYNFTKIQKWLNDFNIFVVKKLKIDFLNNIEMVLMNSKLFSEFKLNHSKHVNFFQDYWLKRKKNMCVCNPLLRKVQCIYL